MLIYPWHADGYARICVQLSRTTRWCCEVRCWRCTLHMQCCSSENFFDHTIRCYKEDAITHISSCDSWLRPCLQRIMLIVTRRKIAITNIWSARTGDGGHGDGYFPAFQTMSQAWTRNGSGSCTTWLCKISTTIMQQSCKGKLKRNLLNGFTQIKCGIIYVFLMLFEPELLLH